MTLGFWSSYLNLLNARITVAVHTSDYKEFSKLNKEWVSIWTWHFSVRGAGQLWAVAADLCLHICGEPPPQKKKDANLEMQTKATERSQYTRRGKMEKTVKYKCVWKCEAVGSHSLQRTLAHKDLGGQFRTKLNIFSISPSHPISESLHKRCENLHLCWRFIAI